MKRDYFLPNKYKKKTEQHFYNEDKNKQVHQQFKIHNEHLKNITKINKCNFFFFKKKTDMKITEKLSSTFTMEH